MSQPAIALPLPAGASLFLQMRFGELGLANGTGFLVRRGDHIWLITNRHNVTGRHQETGQPLCEHGGVPDTVEIIHNAAGRTGEWVVTREPLLDDDGLPRWIEHPHLGEQADVVALLLDVVDDIEVLDYDLEAPEPDLPFGPAMAVSIIGFPFGRTAGGAFPIWVAGFVASVPEIDYKKLPVFLVDARTRSGQSGSPVITYSHVGSLPTREGLRFPLGEPVWQLHGIYAGRITSGSDIGMVWKTSCLIELIEHAEEQAGSSADD
jgi:Trypsin-like peptidase domain